MDIQNYKVLLALLVISCGKTTKTLDKSTSSEAKVIESRAADAAVAPVQADLQGELECLRENHIWKDNKCSRPTKPKVEQPATEQKQEQPPVVPTPTASKDPEPVKTTQQTDPKPKQPISTPKTKAEIVNLCESFPEKILSMSKMLHYADTEGCQFGQNGNATPKNLHHTARKEQSQILSLPQNATLCDLSIVSLTDKVRYDDFFLLLLDDYVLVTSDDSLKYKDASGLMLWDFDRVKGNPFGAGEVECLIHHTKCEFPEHDEEGKVNLEFPFGALSNITEKISDVENIRIRLITTGDNNDKDCKHSGMDLQITGSYVPHQP